MLEPCSRMLDTAEDMVEWGIIDEGVREMVRLRRCAQTGACADWNDCRGRVESAWSERRLAPPAHTRTEPLRY